jgi:hypothetical protein
VRVWADDGASKKRRRETLMTDCTRFYFAFPMSTGRVEGRLSNREIDYAPFFQPRDLFIIREKQSIHVAATIVIRSQLRRSIEVGYY